MTFEQFASHPLVGQLAGSGGGKKEGGRRSVDLSRAASLDVDRELYQEASASGLSLSELLERDEFDPSPHGCSLDAFERQLVLAGVKLSGNAPTTVEQFFQKAPTLMPEFVRREIRRGQALRPELSKLIATSTVVASNRYTPFFIDTSSDVNYALRPLGDGAEIPQLLVAEQTHTVTVRDYGLALKASYKALRHRTTAQFQVLLWYIGFKMQSDKIGMVVDCIINGDGNSNGAAVVNTATTTVLNYNDLITLWSQFGKFEMNTMVAHTNTLKTILTLAEFKDPAAGYRFQQSGELFSPLGATLVRSDDVPTDYVIGLDRRFAIEEVITQPLLVEYDKIIDQRFEEAVITESVTYAKIIREASVILDSVFP